MSQNKGSNSLAPIVEYEVPLNMFENDDKVSYREYQNDLRPPIELLRLNSNQENEDCECECESEFMADMPTNESYTISDDQEHRDDDKAIKFLTETGILRKFDAREYFDLNIRSDSSNLGDIDTFSKTSERLKEKSEVNFRFFEDPFGDEEEFNPAETLEKQLERDPIPEPIIDVCISDQLSDVIVEESYPDIELFSIPSITKSIQPISDVIINSNETKPTFDENDRIIDEESLNLPKSKKKLTEFGYLLQRKGFRLMRKYYKEKFEAFAQSFNYKKRVKVITPGEINQIVLQYSHKEFSAILPVMSGDEHRALLESLKRIVLSDRSNKREPMIEGIDFTVVRNLFGKYTQKNMKLFMRDSANSFLYTHFYLIFGRSACYDQRDVDQINFNDQMKRLMFEAFRNLFTSVKPLYEKLYESNAGKI